MSKYALVVLGLMGVYFLYARQGSGKTLEISYQGEEVEIVQGDNKLIAGQSPEFTINLRIFGYSDPYKMVLLTEIEDVPCRQ